MKRGWSITFILYLLVHVPSHVVAQDLPPGCGECPASPFCPAIWPNNWVPWTGYQSGQGTSGSFHYAANWYPVLGTPGSDKIAVFGPHPCLASDPASIVYFGSYSGPDDPISSPAGDATNDRLRVESGRFVFDLGGQTYTLLRDTGSFSVEIGEIVETTGLPGAAELEIFGQGGVWNTDTVIVAVEQGTSGVLTVDDLVWNNATGLLRLGFLGGVGVATFQNETVATHSSMKIGNQGDGVVNILSGSSVSTISGVSTLAVDIQSSFGSVTVSDPGSSWAPSAGLIVGRAGVGKLMITNEGTVTSGSHMFIAEFPGSSGTATVSGLGSRWTCNANMRIGGEGSALVEVVDGGRLFSNNAVTGQFVGSEADVSVSGLGSQWDVNGWIYGGAGSSSLRVEDGGVVTVSSRSRLGTGSVSESVLQVRGSSSSYAVQDELIVAFASGSQAHLQIADGGHVQANSVEVRAGGVLSGNGSLAGDLTNHGLVSPGDLGQAVSADLGCADTRKGTLSIDGALALEPGGIACFDLDELGASLDQIVVSGPVVVDGTLEVQFAGGTIPPPGTELILIVAESVSGSFANVQSEGVPVSIRYEPQSVVLVVGQATNTAALDHPRVSEPYPNPFNPIVNIEYSLPEPASVAVAIYDVAGRLVRNLKSPRWEAPGNYVVTWRGVDERQNSAPSGVYYARVVIGSRPYDKSLVLVR